MKRTRTALTLCGVLLAANGPLQVLAQESGAAPAEETAKAVDVPVAEPVADVTAPAEQGGWTDFFDRHVAHVQQVDPFGLTALMPAGYGYVKGELSFAEIGGKYDTERKLLSAFPRFVMKNKAGETIADVDMGLEGSFTYQTFEAGYAITDYLTAVVNVPTVSMETSYNPTAHTVDADGDYFLPGAAVWINSVGPRWAVDPKTYSGMDFVNTTLPMLGRNNVSSGYTGDWLLGDVNLGVNWNLYHSKCTSYPCLSASINPRVYLPTGKAQDSNNSLLFGTGTAMDSGLAGWAVGSRQALDVRLFKYSYWVDIVASFQFGARYGFEQDRDYPTTYTKGVWMDMDKASLKDWRPFYDVSKVGGGSFRYTPGWQLDWLAQLQVTSANMTLSAGYYIKFNQDPEVKADYNWNMSVRQWGLMGQGMTESLLLGAQVSLLLLYLPTDIGFQYNKVLDGYNTLEYDDNYTIMIKFNIPLFPDA